jgi:hypothetical protein
LCDNARRGFVILNPGLRGAGVFAPSEVAGVSHLGKFCRPFIKLAVSAVPQPCARGRWRTGEFSHRNRAPAASWSQHHAVGAPGLTRLPLHSRLASEALEERTATDSQPLQIESGPTDRLEDIRSSGLLLQQF